MEPVEIIDKKAIIKINTKIYSKNSIIHAKEFFSDSCKITMDEKGDVIVVNFENCKDDLEKDGYEFFNYLLDFMKKEY